MDWKVYRNGKMVATCHFATDAALLAARGGTVKVDGRIIWNDLREESMLPSDMAKVMEQRRYDRRLAALRKMGIMPWPN